MKPETLDIIGAIVAFLACAAAILIWWAIL